MNKGGQSMNIKDKPISQMQYPTPGTTQTTTETSARRRIRVENNPNCFMKLCSAIREHFQNLWGRLVECCTCSRKLAENYHPITIVGYNRTTINKLANTLRNSYRDLQIELQILARDTDFNFDACKGRKIVLCAEFTERNNIMVAWPDIGEMTNLVYDHLPADLLPRIGLFYAGAPSDEWGISSNEMYRESLVRPLLRTQPKLKSL